MTPPQRSATLSRSSHLPPLRRFLSVSSQVTLLGGETGGRKGSGSGYTQCLPCVTLRSFHLSFSAQSCTAMKKLRIVILRFGTARHWSLNDGKVQNPSNQFGIVPLSNFVPRGFGFVHHSIAILYHEVHKP